MTDDVHLVRDGDVAVLTLSHAARRNALTPRMLVKLERAFRELPSQGVRAAVLTGEGELAFSSGFDTSALPTQEEVWTPGDSALDRALGQLAAGPLPVIAALNGVTIGGALELASSCDLRVAGPSVRFEMPPVRLGLVYSPTGIARLSSLVGAARAREMFLTARAVSAEEALAWGLVQYVVKADLVRPRALELARAIAAQPPDAVAGTRRAFEALLPRPTASASLELAARSQRGFRRLHR